VTGPHDPAPDLRLHPTRLAPAFDLLAACAGEGEFRFLFEREGLGVAAAPQPPVEGHSVEPPAEPMLRALGEEMLATLRAIASPGDPSAPSPVAVGQFPFASDDGHAWLQVPGQAVRRTEAGNAWRLDVMPRSAEPQPFLPARTTGSSPADAFSATQVRESPSAGDYGAAVAEAVQRIRAGDLRKVVLARTVQVDAGRPLDPLRLAHRVRAVDPHAYTFIAPVGYGGAHVGGSERPLLVGASPELLVARHGRTVRSTPLAGSAPRAGDPDEDRANAEALRASAKNREEHAIVVEAIAEVLGPVCEHLRWDSEPVLLETANVWHLATRFEGELRDPAPSVVDLVAALHPTPAVCGAPTEVARALIAQLEPFDRGGYAGPVGWMDANGDGEWAIALRCAELSGDRATLFAGAGIVAGSEPSLEVEETDRKFRAFLDSLRWG
jgi:isochorismate synthase